MTADLELQKVEEWERLRGFVNLFRKENRAWWGTRLWWVNALVWTGGLSGLVGIMLFVLPSLAEAANDPNIEAAGGTISFALEMGRTVFFELGTVALAIGAVVLCQDPILKEKQSGVAEWILSKPVSRQAYILAKLVASLIAVTVLLLGFPAMSAYGLLSIRSGSAFPLLPFLSGLGIMATHTLFYLTLPLMLGTLFNDRIPILGIALGSILGGNLIAGYVKPLLYVSPWMLAKAASLSANAQPLPAGMVYSPLITTTLWSGIFILVTLMRFERTEF
jgi:ABC-2 type transport system permease protein